MHGDPAGRSVRYFLHVATFGRYDEIVAETLTAILASPDFGASDSITIGVVGDGPVSLPLADQRVAIVHKGDDITQYEFPTLDMIHAAARADPSAAFVYLNCLGGRYTGADYLLRARWRTILLYLFVERRRACLTLLDHHDVIGVEWTALPLPHMTSNNWMAGGTHIAGLPPPAAFAEAVATRDLAQFGPRWRVTDILARALKRAVKARLHVDAGTEHRV